MGKKSNYFRHSFSAHCDSKITELLERGGVKAIGVYFILLELYGASLIDDDESCQVQKINLRLIASATGLRSDSAQTCIELIGKCELIEALFFKSPIKYFEVRVPNFLKYFGKYSKAEAIKNPNKSKVKERKEKESKVKKEIVISPQQNEIVSHWNNFGIPKFTGTEKQNKELFKLMGKVNIIETIDAISNYKAILKDGDSFFAYSWTLIEFLKREGAKKFWPNNFIVGNYYNGNNAKVRQDNLLNMEYQGE